MGQSKAKLTEDKKRNFYVKRLTWSVIFGVFLAVVGYSMNIWEKIVAGGFIRKTSLRIFVGMFIIFVFLVTFLLCKTSHVGDISQNMIDEWPAAAFSMSGSILVMAVASFHFCVDLLGIIGVPYFISFWGFTLNTIMILPL